MAKCATIKNTAKNGIEIKFTHQPDDATLAEVKRRGFRWSKFGKIWYKAFNQPDWDWATSFCDEDKKPEPSTAKSSTEPVVPAKKDGTGNFDFYSSSEYTPDNDYERALIDAKLVQWEKGYDKIKEVGNIILGDRDKATVYYYTPKDALCVLISVKWGKDFLARINKDDFGDDFQWLQRKDIANIREKFEEAPRQIWKEKQDAMAKVAKEPWEMTAQELIALYIPKEVGGKTIYFHLPHNVSKELKYSYPNITVEENGRYSFEMPHHPKVIGSSLEQLLKDFHSEKIKYYRVMGKPIPAEVLAEYPELQPNPEPVAVFGEQSIIELPTEHKQSLFTYLEGEEGTRLKAKILDKNGAFTANDIAEDYRRLYRKWMRRNRQLHEPYDIWQYEALLDGLFDKFKALAISEENQAQTTTMPNTDLLNNPNVHIVDMRKTAETPLGLSFFKLNPSKVLGKIVTHNPNTGRELTDAWNKPKPEVWGTMKDVLAGLAHFPDGKRFEHFVPVNVKQLAEAGLSPTEISDVRETRMSETPTFGKPEGRENAKSAIEKSIRKTVNEAKAVADKGGKCDNCTITLEDSIKKYNTNVAYKDANGVERFYDISGDEIKVWISYQVRQGIYDAETIKSNAWGKYYVENPDWRKWHSMGLVAYDGREYVPVSLYYAGNIYERVRIAKENEAAIVHEIGQIGFDEQLAQLEASKPTALLITDDPARKLYLSPFHKIWDEIEITELTNGAQAEKEWNIGSIFYYKYLQNLGSEAFSKERISTTAWDIYHYWIEKERFPNGTDDIQKAAIKRNTQIIGGELFDKFLFEMLTREDRAKIAARWNSQCNNWRDPEWHKIPVGFQVSKRFKGGELKIRPAQREGAAFLNHRGTGILGYDVGVGKTASCILTIEDGLNKGLFRRPLVVVPQKVIKKWIGEAVGVYAEKDLPAKGWKKGDLIAEGVLPHRKVVDYDNLGVAHIGKAKDKAGIAYTVPDGSITFITFEGLEKIGFSRNTEDSLVKKMKAMLSSGESGRAGAIFDQGVEKWIDKALNGTEIDIEDAGWDAIFVDEAHNFRNLFMEVKGDIAADGERQKKDYQSSQGAEPSTRAVKLFMLNTYLHDNYRNRNTYGLTATPFTNRATEIYSMLALFDYEGLKDFDCYNINQFCVNFIEEKAEPAFTQKGKFENKYTIRGYTNLPTLQSIVFRAINYKTGQEVKIPRPEKVVLPLYNDEKGVPLTQDWVVETKLPPHQLQNVWLEKIREFARWTKFNKSENKPNEIHEAYPPNDKDIIMGQALIALGLARTCTFSPYALRLRGGRVIDHEPTPEQFIESSPKLKYVTECIKTVRSHHLATGTPISGQIIYSDTGIEYFGHIKSYLVEYCGYADREVEIFHGETSKGKRESIKEGFLDGNIKIIIGSSTLREGVDLQTHCSCIYVCHLDWNPTDIHQLMGRGWRFGNKFSHIRIIVPLIENSSDPMTWQKLSEKMSRLNSIWTKADGTKMFEEGEIDPEELKKSLINDPVELAKYEIDEEVQAIVSQKALVDGTIKELQEATKMKTEFSGLTNRLFAYAQEAKENPRTQWGIPQAEIAKIQAMEFTPSDIKTVYRIVKAYSKLQYSRYIMENDVDQHIKYATRMKRIEDDVLTKNKLTLSDDFSSLQLQFERKKEELLGELARVRSDENLAEKVAVITAKKEEENANRQPVSERVNQFARLNYLLNCQFSIHTCDIYGRVSEKESGKVIEVMEVPKVEFEVKQAYKMSERLRRFMPPSQRAFVMEAIRENAEEGYLENVVERLEREVAAIPALRSTSKLPEEAMTIYAHFFGGDTDMYITEFDGKETAYGYVILEGDTQNAEWGNIHLPEIHKAKRGLFPAIEMDFHWKVRPFWQVMGHEEPKLGEWEKKEVEKVEKKKASKAKGSKAPIGTDKDALLQAAEALRTAAEFVEGDKQTEMNDAAEALETAAEFL